MAVVGAALLALRLKLFEPVSHALLFGRWRVSVGSLVGFHLSLPFGQVTAVLLDNLGRLFECGYKHRRAGFMPPTYKTGDTHDFYYGLNSRVKGTIPTDAGKPLVYIGFDKDFNPVTDIVCQ